MQKSWDFSISWQNYWKNLIEFYQIKFGMYRYDVLYEFKNDNHHYSLNLAALNDLPSRFWNFYNYFKDKAIKADRDFSFNYVYGPLVDHLIALRDYLREGNDYQRRNSDNYLTELKDYLKLALEKTNSSEYVNVESNISLSNEIFSIRDHLSNILDLLADGDRKSKLRECLNFFDEQANKMKYIMLDFDRLINIKASMAPHTDLSDELKLSIQNTVKSFYVCGLKQLQASIHEYYYTLTKNESSIMLKFLENIKSFFHVFLLVLGILLLVHVIFSHKPYVRNLSQVLNSS